MKHIACSRIWKDVKISPTRKELNNCCKRIGYSPSIEEIEKHGSKIFTSNPDFISEKKEIIQSNKLTSACSDCIRHWPNSNWDVMNDWKDKNWDDKELNQLPFQELTENIEIKLSSTCNMTCIYCNEYSSSLWAKLKDVDIGEDTVWGRKVIEKLYDFVETLTDRSLTFTFLGGEPLLEPDIYEIIDKLSVILQKSNYKHKIRFTTNLNVKPKVIQKFIDITKKYDNIDWIICASIDAAGEAGAEIRDGLDWKLFEQNVITLLNAKSISKFDFQPTMNCLNIPYYKEYLEWIVSVVSNSRGLNDIGNTWSITSNMVTYPRAMYPGVLPDNYNTYVKESMLYLKSVGLESSFQYQALAHLMTTIGTSRNKSELSKVKTFFDYQSKIKNKDYYTVFPHINDILEET